MAGMKITAVIGVILIILGLLALAYREVTYKTQETVLKIGPIQAEAEKQHAISIPPEVGAAAMIAGAALVAAGRKSKK